jgi:hypothetical protein
MIPQNNDIRNFAEHLRAGIENWTKAGEIAAKCCDADPQWPEKVVEQFGDINVDVIYAFERIGRGVLNPKLLLNDSPGCRKLRRLPKHYQDRFLSEPVNLLIKQDGNWETLKIDVRNLEPAQANQVFTNDGVRSEAQQRAWLEERATRESVQIDEAYRIAGKNLVVMSPCQFTRKQLTRLLMEME